MFHPGDKRTEPFRQAVSSIVVLRVEEEGASPVFTLTPLNKNGVIVWFENGSGCGGVKTSWTEWVPRGSEDRSYGLSEAEPSEPLMVRWDLHSSDGAVGNWHEKPVPECQSRGPRAGKVIAYR